MYVYVASFFSGVHITQCFLFEDFQVVWEYPYVKKKTSWSYVFLWENARFTLMLHFEDGHNKGGCLQTKRFLKPGRTFLLDCGTYMQMMTFLWESVHCRGVLTQLRCFAVYSNIILSIWKSRQKNMFTIVPLEIAWGSLQWERSRRKWEMSFCLVLFSFFLFLYLKICFKHSLAIEKLVSNRRTD